MKPLWEHVSVGSDTALSEVAGKAVKEITYHIRHSGEWVIRLGDGTEESAQRMQHAVDTLHPYTEELFWCDEHRSACIDGGVLPANEAIRTQWQATISSVFEQAKLTQPEVSYPILGGREGKHTEEFGYLLAELQYMQRAYPGAQW
jgi:ring-1,2-phenylacetyl-CoA epoxidase subunit PaaC